MLKIGTSWCGYGVYVRNVLLPVILLAINPIVFTEFPTVSGFYPDSGAYLVFSEKLLESHNLYLSGWGHIDAGLILPPLYPALIGIIDRIFGIGSPLLVALWLSTAAILVLSYFLFRTMTLLTGSFVAFLAIAVLQLNYYYILYGTSVLTEGLFIGVLSVATYLLVQVVKEPSHFKCLLLGLVTALLFFSRQIGLFFILPVIGIFLHASYSSSRRSMGKRHLAIYVSGFLVFFAPYSLLLYSQTGKSPLTTHFRLGNYLVVQENEITENETGRSYPEILAQRRKVRASLDDSKEMIGSVVKTNATQGHDVLKSLIGVLISGQYFVNLTRNAMHLVSSMGTIMASIFAASTVFVIYVGARSKDSALLVIPFIVVSYILALSMVTGKVDRYVHVLLPFVYSTIFLALYILTREIVGRVRYMTIIAASVFVTYLLPRTFATAAYFERPTENVYQLSNCRKWIKKDDAVFALHSFDAYLAGGTYRVLPNDSFDKILRYSAYTKVKWLLLNYDPGKAQDIALYGKSPWLRTNGTFVADYRDWISVYWVSEDKKSMLVKFERAHHVIGQAD